MAQGRWKACRNERHGELFAARRLISSINTGVKDCSVHSKRANLRCMNLKRLKYDSFMYLDLILSVDAWLSVCCAFVF